LPALPRAVPTRHLMWRRLVLHRRAQLQRCAFFHSGTEVATVLPPSVSEVSIIDRLFKTADPDTGKAAATAAEGERKDAGGAVAEGEASPHQERRVWSLSESYLSQLSVRGSYPRGGFVKVAEPSGADTAVLLVDSSLSPPIRVVGYGLETVSEEYVGNALREALAYRLRMAHEGRLELDTQGHTSAFRLVHELGDGLTGIAIDIYGRFADVQTYSVHWDRFLPFIRETLWSDEFLPFLRGIAVRRRFRKQRPTVRLYTNPRILETAGEEDEFVGKDSSSAKKLQLKSKRRMVQSLPLVT